MVMALVVNTLAALVLAHGAWWTFLSCVAVARPSAGRQILPERRPTIVVVVPAHNEAAHIEGCVASLKSSAADYGPASVLVVADNCSDDTARLAEDAGARVLERHDPARLGKHYALEYAIADLGCGTPPGIVAFVDADSTVSTNFVDAIAAALTGNADAVQVHYATRSGTETSLARIRRVAFLLAHWSRPLGASRIGLGTGIKGNGMAVTWTIAAGGLGGEGITEDAAMTLSLAEHGIAVRFVPAATVWGEMPERYADARTQDTRWEGGRFALAPRALRVALGELVRCRIATAAAAVEIASLPLSLLVAGSVVAAVAAPVTGGSLILATGAGASLFTYVAVGALAARVSWRDLVALLAVPRFLLYKAGVYARIAVHGRPSTWERTGR